MSGYLASSSYGYHQPRPIQGQPPPSLHQPTPIPGQPPQSFHQPTPIPGQPPPSFHQPTSISCQPPPSFHQPTPIPGQPPPSFHQPTLIPGQPPPSFHQPTPIPGQPPPSLHQPFGPSPYDLAPPQHYGGPESQYPYVVGGASAPPASPFVSLVPSAFPPNTDPNVVACFKLADEDENGFIDDKELQTALSSSYNQGFSLRTVRLLMYMFTNSNSGKIGPKEFTALFYRLHNWRDIFEKFDSDKTEKIDINELRAALMSLGFAVSPVVLDLLVSKYDQTGAMNYKAIGYDNFIECLLMVKGLTEKFKERDPSYSGSATFTYEDFMLVVLPFLIA